MFKGKFYDLNEDLRPYFGTLISSRIAYAEGASANDVLYPGPAEMHFVKGRVIRAAIEANKKQDTWPFVVTGPTSRGIYFSVYESEVWSLTLRPLGWAKYIGIPATQLTDQLFNGCGMEPFNRFSPILEMTASQYSSHDRIAEWISDFLREQADEPPAQADQILACQQALHDPDTSTVAQLADKVGIPTRSLERLCARHFGFPPKFLLRRQRFLRSISQFMLESRKNWSEALDGQYFDQAQFVREFRKFMHLTPREFASMPHPVLDVVLKQRMTDLGATKYANSHPRRALEEN
ncbi:helix-turn-helix domain-containing protein [Altererythrobacter indicus]|uniref:Helix-turn-helix domain-containing protein n=1 Tax=Altericroceibacterium indicum TaxID=374177 RepID=A0A845AC82_9SPHN|nr:helix-turn-helix domain-containing protein [Altericroceibacterium indicum]